MITIDFNRLRLGAGCRILDIGCGSGRHTCAAHRFAKAVTIGADLRLNELQAAKDRITLHEKMEKNADGLWALAAADATRLPFKNDAFDLVICSEVLEHVAEDAHAAGEMVRVLKPGRTLAVSVPRFLPERICWALSRDYRASNNGHIRIYRKRKLIRFLEEFGLKCQTIHHAHSLHTPYWWLKCLMGPDRQDVVSVNLYHRFLSWDILKKPKLVAWVDKLLNPIMGKSLVVYMRKEKTSPID